MPCQCFIVRDASGQALGYFYYDEAEHHRAVNKRRTKEEARRITADIAKLRSYCARPKRYRSAGDCIVSKLALSLYHFVGKRK
jgi:hypothetical protein